MAADPGTTWVYNSGATELLAGIFQQATGQDIGDYAKVNLFTPLGITNYYWKRTPKGLPDTEGGLYFTAPDLRPVRAALAEWRHVGRRAPVLGRTWAAESVKPVMARHGAVEVQASNGGSSPYGAANDRLAWVMNSSGRQRLIVIPDSTRSPPCSRAGTSTRHPPLPIKEMVDRLVAAVAK